MGGVRHLTALLHSRSSRCIEETATAISYIVQDDEQNKFSVIADKGYSFIFFVLLLPLIISLSLSTTIFLLISSLLSFHLFLSPSPSLRSCSLIPLPSSLVLLLPLPLICLHVQPHSAFISSLSSSRQSTLLFSSVSCQCTYLSPSHVSVLQVR